MHDLDTIKKMNAPKVKHTKLYDKYSNIIESGKIEESEILSLRSVLNNYKKTSLTDNEKMELTRLIQDTELTLSVEQTEKGINHLNNLRKTPRGIERKNNPFDEREEMILDNFSHFTLNGFYDNGSPTMLCHTNYHSYFANYTVNTKDGDFFTYNYINGKVITD